MIKFPRGSDLTFSNAEITINLLVVWIENDLWMFGRITSVFVKGWIEGCEINIDDDKVDEQ